MSQKDVNYSIAMRDQAWSDLREHHAKIAELSAQMRKADEANIDVVLTGDVRTLAAVVLTVVTGELHLNRVLSQPESSDPSGGA